MCIRIFIFNFKKKKRQKAKETKEEKRIFVEKLTGYYDIVCEFSLCTFNVLDRVVQRHKYSMCYTTTTYKVHTFKNKHKGKLVRDNFVYHFLFLTCLFCFYLYISVFCYNRNTRL